MLKKINRFSVKKEFLEVKEKGDMKCSPIFGYLFLKKNDDQKKFGFIISKKISKRAVDRNKIKRRLSESIRINLSGFIPGSRIIFLVKKNILGKKLDEIYGEVKKIISNF